VKVLLRCPQEAPAEDRRGPLAVDKDDGGAELVEDIVADGYEAQWRIEMSRCDIGMNRSMKMKVEKKPDHNIVKKIMRPRQKINKGVKQILKVAMLVKRMIVLIG